VTPLPPPQFLTASDGSRLIYALTQDTRQGVVAQLIAARSGEGTSSLVRDLSLIAARVPECRVLLLDLDPPGRKQAAQLRASTPEAATQRMPGIATEIMVHRLGDSLLHVSEMRGEPPANAQAWASVMPVLRASFSIVLVDTPALQRSFDGVMLAPYVDTTVLVVEAEATRSAVAQNLRDRILEVGGRIAGSVLNKRQFHIPTKIYARL
jgi:Mrp family chromosome partitioning ATPase